MEGLAPPLKCAIEIRTALQNGEPVRAGLMRYLEVAGGDDFASDVRHFIFCWDQGQNWRAVIARIKSPHRRALLELVASGFSGQPILNHLSELQSEIEDSVDLEIREYMELLPVKMLIPLLLFQFPAFLILLFGPLLRRLIEEMNR